MTHRNSEVLHHLAAGLALVCLMATPHAQVQGSPQAPPRPAGTGLIAGQVVDVDTGRGIPGAVIMTAIVTSTGGGGQTSGTTAVAADSQGRFFLANLRAGSYTLLSQTPGYTSAVPNRQVPLDDGGRVTDVKVSLRRLVSVSGRVVDDSGTPVVNVEMVLLTRAITQGRPPALVGSLRTRTNDRGDYRISNVPPGEYLVCACARDPIPFDGHLLTTLAARPLDLLGAAGRAVTAGSDAVSLDASLKTLPVTFYPGVTVASQAERVRVASGEDKTGVDLTMTAVRAARVSGRIVGATSSVNAAHLRLRVMTDTPEGAGITQILPMLVQPDGRFDFANVPPGEYVLDVNFRPGARGGGPSGAALAFVGARAQAMQPPPTSPSSQGRGGGPADPALAPLWAQEPISVGERDVTGLVIPLNRSLTVTGRVTFAGSAPQPSAQDLQRLSMLLTSVEAGPMARNHFAPMQPDGTFQMSGVLPGRHVLIANLSPPWSVRSVTASGDDFTDATIEIGADLNVHVTITDASGEISGRVSPASASDDARSWVRLFPTERRYWAEPFSALRRFRTGTVATDGRFSVTGLPAGEYFLVVATESGSGWMDAPTLELLSRTAERVRVNDGDKLVVEVRR